MNPTVAIVAQGAMGAGIGARLVERGLRVITSLAGRSGDSAQRAMAAGMVAVSDEECARARHGGSVERDRRPVVALREPLERPRSPSVGGAECSRVPCLRRLVEGHDRSRVAECLGHSVDSRDDGLERGVDDVRVHPHSPHNHAVLTLADLTLHVRCGECVTTRR